MATLHSSHQSEITEHETIDSISVFALDVVSSGTMDPSWRDAYQDSVWFGNIYRFLDESLEASSAALILGYRMVRGILWVHCGDLYLSCVPESKVLDLLTEAHNKSGHLAKTSTMVHLQRKCYWPGEAFDVEKYIAGCLDCAQHGSATRSQLLNPVLVSHPFQLIGMDFVGSLPITKVRNVYILNIACYFSWFIVPFSCTTSNVKDVTQCLQLFFAAYKTPHTIYCDWGQHFDDGVLRRFLKTHGVSIDYSPSGASKSTSMIEMSNRLLEKVLQKNITELDRDERLAASAKSVNDCIILYLGLSLTSINFGNIYETSLMIATLFYLPGQNIQEWHRNLITSLHTAITSVPISPIELKCMT